jgi:hypothetical protein
MKKALFILSIFIILSCKENNQTIANNLAIQTSQNQDQDKKIKRYDVKSGIVKYKITTSGKVMGSTVNGSGTESLYFKNFGALELVEEKSTKTTKMKFFGKEKVETTNVHIMNKLDNNMSYHVNFEQQIIIQSKDLAMDMMLQTNTDAGKAGKNMLESFGGKKIGAEIFKGYNCDIWDISGAKQWMYKGVVLKMEISIMGIKTVKEAITADFNTIISNDHFKLPNFSIQKMDEESNDFEDNENLDKLSKMSFEEWKKMATKDDPETEKMSDKELRQVYDMMQKMIKMKQGK